MAPSAVDVGPTSGPQIVLKAETITKAPSTRSQPEHEEYQYLDLIRDIIDNGEHRPDRTGTGTYSLFAPRAMRFSLSRPSTGDSASPPIPVLPLLTTKRVFLRAVITELLWFISGSTTSTPLTTAGIHIWDGNASRAYLDSIGLTSRPEGDLGPVYGFQWRHSGAAYVDAQTDYRGQGVDQLAEVVRKLRHTPWDRRIILSAWNPSDLPLMALPPCHMFAQFYVSFPRRARRRGGGLPSSNGANNGSGVKGKSTLMAVDGTTEEGEGRGILHTHLYQRSCDMGLGIPFNIASYALLTHLLAHVCDLQPGTLTHSMGDAHVYLDHVDALEEQLRREPRDFPTVVLEGGETRGRGVGTVEGLDGWTVDDIKVEGYRPHGKVAMKMSV